jgi:hypothetical protein
MPMKYTPIGQVTHFYRKICVAVLSLAKPLQVGDVVHIAGYTTDFCQEVHSLQIDHRPVERARPGDDVALRVEDRVREGDTVYRVEAEGEREVVMGVSDVLVVR